MLKSSNVTALIHNDNRLVISYHFDTRLLTPMMARTRIRTLEFWITQQLKEEIEKL